MSAQKSVSREDSHRQKFPNQQECMHWQWHISNSSQHAPQLWIMARGKLMSYAINEYQPCQSHTLLESEIARCKTCLHGMTSSFNTDRPLKHTNIPLQFSCSLVWFQARPRTIRRQLKRLTSTYWVHGWGSCIGCRWMVKGASPGRNRISAGGCWSVSPLGGVKKLREVFVCRRTFWKT